MSKDTEVFNTLKQRYINVKKNVVFLCRQTITTQ